MSDEREENVQELAGEAGEAGEGHPIGDEADDEFITPESAMGPNEHLKAKEDAILWDKPLEEIRLPSGKVLRVYAKSAGQNERIEEALQEWLDALKQKEEHIARTWRFWSRRRKKVKEELGLEKKARLRLFFRIFEDLYNEHQHQELTWEDLLSMTTADQQRILRAYREGNHVENLLREIIPDYEKKKDWLLQEIYPNGMLTS